MFQRLKGAIDSRIAEEQARQRASQASSSRSNQSIQIPSSRTTSPGRRVSRTPTRERKDGQPLSKGPDPSEFEPEFVIEDEDATSRSETPRSGLTQDEIPAVKGASNGDPPEAHSTGEGKARLVDVPSHSQELPTDVRVKLRKLDKLELRYQELLKSYRVAHARVVSIEQFETTLRENTPLTSINDPAALVEYLNQLNLGNDMVRDELKRVSNERDRFQEELEKAKLQTENSRGKAAELQNQDDAQIDNIKAKSVGQSNEPIQEKKALFNDRVSDEQISTKVVPPIVSDDSRSDPTNKSATLSTETQSTTSFDTGRGQQEIFSYDKELSKLETELEEKQDRVSDLQNEVNILRENLAVAQESTQSMVGTLEESSRELHSLREHRERSEVEYETWRLNSEKSIHQLQADLLAAESRVKTCEANHSSYDPDASRKLEQRLIETLAELDKLRSEMKLLEGESGQVAVLSESIQKLEAEKIEISSQLVASQQNEKRNITLNNLVKNLRAQLLNMEEDNIKLTAKLVAVEKTVQKFQYENQSAESKPFKDLQDKKISDDNQMPQGNSVHKSKGLSNEVDAIHTTSGLAKKKNKRKKKGGNSNVSDSKDVSSDLQTHPTADTPTLLGIPPESQEANTGLPKSPQEAMNGVWAAKDSQIEQLQAKLKNQEELMEEIETLRDDLIHVGQDHVETKDRLKQADVEKRSLENIVQSLREELTQLQKVQVSSKELEQSHKDVLEQFESLKVGAATLKTSLSASEQLATARYKDIVELKAILQKAQPELSMLRSEVTELKSVKETLLKREAEVKDLDVKLEDLHIELARLKEYVTERDVEIKELNMKIGLEVSKRLKAEGLYDRTYQDIQKLEAKKHASEEATEELSRDLARLRSEIATSKKKSEALEHQISNMTRDSEIMKEEIDLKTAQYASAQSLLSSMRDQTAEMAMQMKEARDRCDSLEEEVTETHKLLSERSREGETMRRLLADAEGRVDARIREMKERMDIAIDERDRAEDEASAVGRRKAREMEDLRAKMRESERDLQRAMEEKEELDLAQRDWRRRREELEHKSDQCIREAAEFRRAMSELRDALDESERLVRELEQQKSEMQRSMEDTQHRFEKLQKSTKVMADELKTLQTARAKALDSETQSSRSSVDSSLPNARISSPMPKTRGASSTLSDSVHGQASTMMDYVYLKNVLLQFLEQKDKKHQMQLIPVLGTLLHFDRKDEQKWMSTIAAR